jgi:hypothetical protein
VIFGAGAYAGPHLATLVASFKASRALKDAEALVAKAEADADALRRARVVVAAQPKPAPSGTTGPVGPTSAAGAA